MWVQSICVKANSIFVNLFESLMTKSPPWYSIQDPGLSRWHSETTCWPSDVVSWNRTGLISHPWMCSTLQIRRPNFFEDLPSWSLKKRLYVSGGNLNSNSPLTSNHHICTRYATVWNLDSSLGMRFQYLLSSIPVIESALDEIDKHIPPVFLSNHISLVPSSKRLGRERHAKISFLVNPTKAEGRTSPFFSSRSSWWSWFIWFKLNSLWIRKV